LPQGGKGFGIPDSGSRVKGPGKRVQIAVNNIPPFTLYPLPFTLYPLPRAKRLLSLDFGKIPVLEKTLI